ncbi:hypothetical protein TNIN_235631 [Trichonephila inaurata madagascariensis]|uniref:Uncharacterized protein n=1 Tax=Trichonephila inaurata madagascariensis TaxID=2747483 RepID=A0A8X7BZF6_9ARAC|nr:hypothetical protein TNIN_235631 [Trichonephila inaurata madagascariensis]
MASLPCNIHKKRAVRIIRKFYIPKWQQAAILGTPELFWYRQLADLASFVKEKKRGYKEKVLSKNRQDANVVSKVCGYYVHQMRGLMLTQEAKHQSSPYPIQIYKRVNKGLL